MSSTIHLNEGGVHKVAVEDFTRPEARDASCICKTLLLLIGFLRAKTKTNYKTVNATVTVGQL